MPASVAAAPQYALSVEACRARTPLHCSPYPPDDCKPDFWPTLRELDVGELRAHLEPGCLNGFDLPALGEGVVEFPTRYPTRALRPRFLIAEARQKQPAARHKHSPKPLDVAAPVVIG